LEDEHYATLSAGFAPQRKFNSSNVDG